MVYSLDPYYGGWFTYTPVAAQDYTPIVIDFTAAVQDVNEDPIDHQFRLKPPNKPRYTIRINPPRSSRRGGKHYLPDSVIIPLGSDNTFRVKLPPSNFYYPFGRYIVEYFRYGSQIPIDTQYWLVPALPQQMQYAFVYDSSEPTISLPFYVWNISSIDPAVEFISAYNRIQFIATTLPPNGTGLTAIYEPAATLDQLLEYSHRNLDGISRIRP